MDAKWWEKVKGRKWKAKHVTLGENLQNKMENNYPKTQTII